MNTKVLLVCSLFLVVALAQNNACLLTILQTAFCTSSTTCTLDATLLTTLCVGTSPILTLSLPPSVTVNLNGGSTFSLGGLIINVSDSTSGSTTVNLNNAIAIAGDLVVTGSAVVHAAAGAVVTVSGNVQVAAQATLDVAGNVTVQGTVAIYGTIHLAGDMVDSAAQTAWLVAKSSTVQIQGSASASAYITGNGGIDASVALSGNVTIAVGNSPGIVYINGDLSMSDTTTLKLDVDSSTSFDKLIISGNFKRNGILYANFENGYVPISGTVFVFASHSNSQGSFETSHGDYTDSTFSKVHPKYSTLSTSFQYGSAANIAIPFVLVALCIFALVF